MKKRVSYLILIFSLIVSSLCFVTASYAIKHNSQPAKSVDGLSDFSPDEILVKFKSGIPQNEKEKFHNQLGTKVKEKIDQLDVEIVAVPKSKVTEFVTKYKNHPKVEYAEPNFIATALEITNDPDLSKQWGMYKVQAAGIDTSAWNFSQSDPSVSIAILDSGIDESHPDLAGKVVKRKNCTSSRTNADRYGHGTHVAGIAAAETNNLIGVAGLGYRASLMNVKVLGDNGSGFYSWIAKCLTWAADNGAKVTNMSLGGSSSSRTLETAVNYAWSKGVVLAAAAGNSGDSSPTYPAYYTNAIAVAAIDDTDSKPSWSSYGSWVDVAAPGVNIWSTFPTYKYKIGKSTYYDYGSGTSMATPHVAGLAALVWTTSYGTSNTNVRKQIETTADDIPNTGIYWVYGRINALSAVK